MSDCKHTPGPWVAGKTLTCGWQDIDAPIESGSCYKLAKVAVMVNRESSEEGIANARLIAAAPEMIQALERICEQFDGPGLHEDQRDAIELAQNAIAKAKGEQQ